MKNKIPNKEDLVYPDYKEPLRALKEGYGYFGTVALSKDKKKIQCHICGKMYKSVSSHLSQTHGMTVEEYKDKFGLAGTTTLIGNATRKKFRDHYNKTKRKFLEHHRQKGLKGTVERNKERKGNKLRMEIRNKRGNCPDQLIDKITKLYDKLGRAPSVAEYRKEYGKGAPSQLYYYFGLWDNAFSKAGIKSFKKQKEEKYTKEKLIEAFQTFYKRFNRTPQYSDLGNHGLPSRTPVRRLFDTMNIARYEAGVPLLVKKNPTHAYSQYVETMDYHLYEDELV